PDPLGPSPSDEEEARFEKLQLAANRWAAQDDATVLAITDLLPLSKQQHFEQKVMAKGLFDAIIKRYSTPTTESLRRLVLPFLFPDLPSFHRVPGLVLHLRSLDAQLRSAAPHDALLAAKPLPPPPSSRWMTLYLLSTRLLDRFATAHDHFLTCFFPIVVDDFSRFTTEFPFLLVPVPVSFVVSPWTHPAGISTTRSPTNSSVPRTPLSTSQSVTTGVVPTEVLRPFPPTVPHPGATPSRPGSPPPPPPPSRPAQTGVSHVTPQSSPPQRPVPVVSGGAGGAAVEGEGTRAAGAGGAGFGGTGGTEGVVGRGSGSGGAGARGMGTAMSTPCTVYFVTRVQCLDRLEREEREHFERARQQ
ncbi:unnamed protein product, partial [Closterium sp. NIES-54]